MGKRIAGSTSKRNHMSVGLGVWETKQTFRKLWEVQNNTTAWGKGGGGTGSGKKTTPMSNMEIRLWWVSNASLWQVHISLWSQGPIENLAKLCIHLHPHTYKILHWGELLVKMTEQVNAVLTFSDDHSKITSELQSDHHWESSEV